MEPQRGILQIKVERVWEITWIQLLVVWLGVSGKEKFECSIINVSEGIIKVVRVDEVFNLWI